MKLLRPLLALALCYAIFSLCVTASFDRLPDYLATHFDFQGRANGWMGRRQLVAFTIGLVILMPVTVASLLAVVGFIPAYLGKISPRDSGSSQGRVRRFPLLGLGLWFACLNVLLVTGLYGLIVRANALEM